MKPSFDQCCLYDNMKTVVDRQDESGEAIWNKLFARFTQHYGFVLRRCMPYRARTKGKVYVIRINDKHGTTKKGVGNGGKA
ncbi:transposase [Paenibacillus popilliae]|uniref:Transposase and inactivated derivative n=1 Tax=Paenibacillus popilliae ATCC 14706 TaxID=1212764 RepID=M9L855_PAEPP|nr:transposase [Paenibacillus popilliae]GAC41292.1 transposase and inactivated derivative [Paenibacillus popilliae ATCC 14706]